MERKYGLTRYGKISYLDGNGGYPLIFLHGFGGTGNTWLKSEPYMDRCIRPIFIDLLGHGHSDKPEIVYTIEQQAESIMDIINELGLKKFSIAGNSYGGWISLKLASGMIEPDMLFLIDSAGISPAISEGSIEEMNEIINSILKVRNYKNRDALVKIMENNKRPEEKINDGEFLKIKCPTTIIWGENDNTIPVSYAHIINDKIPQSQLILVKGTGHTPFINKPEEFAGIINKAIIDSGVC
ncbi:alpha/beta hydrolase [Ferroplasma sp.]|uniref:alpha/beta fold hydrolase n=1 Tax=Ferroplasma sp. TaxID=2591003 RepID=UPI00307E6A7E